MARDTHAIIDFKWAITPAEANDVVRPMAQLIITGWNDSYTVDEGNKPLQESFNYLMRGFSAALKELNRRGIYEWDATTDFEDPCACLLGGKVYFSKPGMSPGVNVNPSQANTVWTKGWAPGDLVPLEELPIISVDKGGTGRDDGANLIPAGGTRHYVLRKASNADFDMEFAEIVIPNMPITPDSTPTVSIIIRTTNYNVEATDNNAIVMIGTGSGNRTIFLPNLAAANAGFIIRIKKTTSSNTATIQPANAAHTIDGNSAMSLRDIQECVTLAWSGAVWVILSRIKATAWGEVTGKPSVFPSSWNNVVGKPATFPSQWRQISDIPATFPSQWRQISDIPATFSSQWSQISDIPATFPSQWSQISGIPATFSSQWSQISDIPATFPSQWSQISGIPEASTAERGIVELETDDETESGTGTTRAVTSRGLRLFGDSRYVRREMLLDSDTVIPSSGATQQITTSGFGSSDYRWIEVTYRVDSAGAGRITSAMPADQLVQDFPQTTGVPATPYAINETNDALYVIDETTGTASRVHATNTLGGGHWEGAFVLNSTMYVVNDANNALYTVDVTGGTAARVHPTNTIANAVIEAAFAVGGVGYAVNVGEQSLWRINVSDGTAQRVHPMNMLGGGASVVAAFTVTGVGYVIDNENSGGVLYRVDVTNGTSVRVHASNTIGAGDWKSSFAVGGVAYAINNDNNALYEIDVTNGTASRVHSSNTLGVGDWQASASAEGEITINEPAEGFHVPEADRLTLWRTASDLQSRLRSTLVRGDHAVTIEQIVGIS